jgi:hypothetical protein
MKIVSNTKLVHRNARIGQFTTLAALFVLGVGLYLTFKMPDKFAYSLGCLLFGFLLSQIGIYFGNRWGRSPRPDEIINKNMKGLGRDYTIYHYTTPVSHFLVGPAGLWIILQYYQGGRIVFDGKRWRSRGGGFARSYMRIFGQESMGRPDIEKDTEIRSVEHYLERLLPEDTQIPEIKVALLFTDPKVELQVEKSPIPAMKPDGLKDFLKRAARERPISELALAAIRNALPKADQDTD